MNKKATKSFNRQLTKSFICIVLIPVLLLGGFILLSGADYVKERAETESMNVIEQNLADLNNRIQISANSIKYLAANYNLQDFLLTDTDNYLELSRISKTISELFYNVLTTNPYFKTLHLFTNKELYLLTDFMRPESEAKNETWYRLTVEAKDNYWWHENDGIFIARKIMAAYPETAIGVIKVEIKKSMIEDSFHIFQQMPIHIAISDGNEKIYEYFESQWEGNVGFEKTETLGIENWKISYEIDAKYYSNYMLISFAAPGILVSVVLILVWIMIQFFVKRLDRDLSCLVQQVECAQKGDLDIEIKTSEITEINMLAESIQSFLNKIKQLIRQVYAKEIERQDLEINLLQSKMNPHFLYNNLSAINWLALEHGQDKIYEITTELAAFYRTALNKGRNVDRLEIEIQNIKAYLHLQLMSHEDSFDAEFDIDESLLDYSVPIFILQPLVENSIEHGIDKLRDARGKIKISVNKKEDSLYMTVWDNGKWLYEEIGKRKFPEEKYGYGTGNIHKRLRLLYGESCGLEIYADEEGTSADVHFKAEPLKTVH